MALKQAKLTGPAAPAAFVGAKKGNRAIITPDLERLEERRKLGSAPPPSCVGPPPPQ